MTWDDLEYWRSQDWRLVQTRLDGLGDTICPKRQDLFKALDLCPLEATKVVIVGQDPYPDPKYATGVAFSIPPYFKTFPLTLGIMFEEYVNDLHYPLPSTGDLTPWTKQGVLLWNAVPSCTQRESLSHYSWTEWQALTKEIIAVSIQQGAVIALLGRVAQEYQDAAQGVSADSQVMFLAHPAASRYGKTWRKNLFSGSRFFTTVNSKLEQMAKEPIDWRLP